jgi:hypothetical protein
LISPPSNKTLLSHAERKEDKQLVLPLEFVVHDFYFFFFVSTDLFGLGGYTVDLFCFGYRYSLVALLYLVAWASSYTLFLPQTFSLISFSLEGKEKGLAGRKGISVSGDHFEGFSSPLAQLVEASYVMPWLS